MSNISNISNISIYDFLKSHNIVNKYSHLFPLQNFQKINSKYGQISNKDLQILNIVQYLQQNAGEDSGEDSGAYTYTILLLPIFLQNLIKKYGINSINEEMGQNLVR